MSGLLIAALAGVAPPSSQAAGLDPLPAVAKALAGVTSYQVVVTSSFSGAPRSARRRPSGTPTPGAGRGQGELGFGFGARNRTITAVRKGSFFEDYVVSTGKDRSGKPVTSSVIVYGTKICTEGAGARTYTCQTMTNQYTIDPTAAFVGGAGAAVFTQAKSKVIGGQSCAGYAYLNQSATVTGKGVVYISSKTNLPCEQDASLTRKAATGSGTFTQTTISIWSRFNDKRLTVPAVPAS